MYEHLEQLGWAHIPDEGFIGHNGGMWRRRHEGADQFGFLALPIHSNRNGVVHGGMLMSFVDRALGTAAREASGARRGATISLNHQFMAPLQLGQFAAITPKVVKLTTRMAFMEGLVTCDEAPVLSAQGVWRLATERA